MFLAGYTLVPISLSSIDVVRNWRNDPSISDNMDYQEFITDAAQQKWFESLNNSENYYYLIKSKQQFIGLIHLNCFDEIKMTAHAGLFIGEKKYRGTGASLAASILILSFAFETLDLRSIYAKVNKNNSEIIKYNHLLGFVIDSEMDEKFQLYILTTEKFREKKQSLINLLSAVNQ